MKRMIFFFWTFILAGCQTALPLANIPDLEPVVISHKTRPIAFDSVVVELKRGDVYAAHPYFRWSFDDLDLSWWDVCNIGLKNRFSGSLKQWTTGETFFGGWNSEAATFVETPLKELGYNVVSHQTSAFHKKQEKRRAELLLAGHIVEIQSNICDAFNILHLRDTNMIAGNMTIRVQWEVFDILKDEVVARFESPGFGLVPQPTSDGQQLLLLRALENAVDHLAHQESFIQLLTGRFDVSKLLKAEKDQSVLSVQVKKQSTETPIYEQAPVLKRAVVSVGTDGTGFFIGSDGYILSSLRPIGNADKVAVEDSQGTRFVARVVRRNERLRVALLQVDVQKHKALSVAPEKLTEVLSDVFTIGNPSDFMARSTMARGTISSWRHQSRFAKNLIQASIPTTLGYAGAPLLDEYGHVLGIHDGHNTGESSFSYYVPIWDVLRALKIEFIEK